MNSMEFVCARCGEQYGRHVERCWAGCSASGYVMPAHFRPATALRPKRVGMSAKELARSDQKLVEIARLPGLKLGVPSVTVIAGPPGHLKSTAGLAILGEVLPGVLFSFEEGLSATVGDRLRRLELRREDLFIEVPSSIREAYAILDHRCPRALLIDSLSVSTFTIHDLVAVAEARRMLVFAINHITKGGDVAGDAAVEYGADCVIRCEDGRWRLTKNRFGGLTEGVLPWPMKVVSQGCGT